MTQHIYNLDWFAGNESVKYPLDSKASCIPTGYEYVPQELLGVITDISFNIPSSLTDEPYLSALTITDDLLTLVICAGSNPLFAFSSTQRSLYTNRYYTLTSFATGCSGVITFGESAKTHRCAYKFADPSQAGFLPSVYHQYMDYPVISVGRKDGASSYQKDIFFRGEGDVKVETGIVGEGDEARQVLYFSLAEGTLNKYIGPCDERPESGTCARSSIEKILCVTPDEDGNIGIEGDGIDIEVKEGQLTLSTNYIVSDICQGDKISTLLPDDYCCEDCQKEEHAEEEDSGCDGKVKAINFNSEVYAEGIAIDYKGLSPVGDDAVELSIPKLSDIMYFQIRVTRPETGGYCQITYGQGQDTVIIRETEAVWDRTYDLQNSDTKAYPNRVEVVIDHCNGDQYLAGDGKHIADSSCNTNPFSASIEFKKCTIEVIKYRNE